MVTRSKSRSNIRWQLIVFELIGTIMCSCAGNINIIPSQIKSSEDSIIMGRVRVVSGREGAILAPEFKLINMTDGSSSALYLFGEWSFQKSWKGQNEGYAKPVFRTATPGEYIFGISTYRGQFIPLTRFRVTKGKLVYFGTIELALRISGGFLQDISLYLERHKVVDEFEETMNLFREEFPQIYEMYKQNVEIIPQR